MAKPSGEGAVVAPASSSSCTPTFGVREAGRKDEELAVVKLLKSSIRAEDDGESSRDLLDRSAGTG